MIIGRIQGTVVATRKDQRLEGKKLLIVRPIDLQGKDDSGYLVALDTVGAGFRETVLAFGRPSSDVPAAGRGARFTRIDGTFALADQTIRSPDIMFTSPDFDMSGGGSVRLPSGAVDLSGNVVLSPQLTAQAGADLRRYAQENGRIVVPATITGTLSNPVVRINAVSAAGRAVENEVKRRLRGLLDRISK